MAPTPALSRIGWRRLGEGRWLAASPRVATRGLVASGAVDSLLARLDDIDGKLGGVAHAGIAIGLGGALEIGQRLGRRQSCRGRGRPLRARRRCGPPPGWPPANQSPPRPAAGRAGPRRSGECVHSGPPAAASSFRSRPGAASSSPTSAAGKSAGAAGPAPPVPARGRRSSAGGHGRRGGIDRLHHLHRLRRHHHRGPIVRIVAVGVAVAIVPRPDADADARSGRRSLPTPSFPPGSGSGPARLTRHR